MIQSQLKLFKRRNYTKEYFYSTPDGGFVITEKAINELRNSIPESGREELKAKHEEFNAKFKELQKQFEELEQKNKAN